MAARPDVFWYLLIGLKKAQRIVKPQTAYKTYSALRIATDLPVSMADDKRLFANTSGDTSLKIWLVARYRRMRPGE